MLALCPKSLVQLDQLDQPYETLVFLDQGYAGRPGSLRSIKGSCLPSSR